MHKRAALIVGFALVALLSGAVGGAAAVILARPPATIARTTLSVNESLGTSFSVQGRLEDGGSLANGQYDFELRLFNAETEGAQVGDTESIEDVTVTDGLFTLAPDFGNVFDGQALWLEVSVRPGASAGAFTPLSPRHALTGAPYALGLQPELRIDTDDSADNPFVFNLVNDSAAAEADVIKAYSTSGEGIEGYSTGGDAADTGVYGQSNGTGTADAGVRGFANGAGPGLYGQGVGAEATSYGVRGISSATHGVYGESNAGSSAYFGGWFTGEKGVFGQAENISGDGTYGFCSDGSSCWGARGHSTDGYGVQGNTSRSDQMYGLHTSDLIYAGAGYDTFTGFSLIAQNGGDVALEIGDVVVVAGLSEAFEDPAASPMLAVRRADNATAGSVIGVVERVIQIEMVSKPEVAYQERAIPDPERQEADDSQWLAWDEQTAEYPVLQAVEGPAGSGAYVVIRVNGLAQMRVDATAAAIDVGMPLVAGDAGVAVQADVAISRNGAENALIIGQAMEPLAEGTGLIWVLVSPR